MSRYIVETEEYRGHKIEILLDECAENPRTEWDNLCELHVVDSRYYLGEHRHKDVGEITDVVEEAEKRGDMVLWLHAYIHGCVVLSLRPFYGRVPGYHAEFDSGCCGVCIVRKSKALREFGRKRWTKKIREKVYKIAEAEVETFTKWLNGEVYGFRIDDGDGDSCWGFYSIDEALAEARSCIG
ncbi:MAG: hypothetical protein WBJ84_10000 [Bacteroidales bacterium]